MKWRFFRHLLGGNDPDSGRVYSWHIAKRSGNRMEAGLPTDGWKRTPEDYVASAGVLAASMSARGFLMHEAVPIDCDGELLGGAHRVACALACGISEIPVYRKNLRVWAPAWGYDWFMASGMGEDDLARLCADWTELTRN